MFRKIIDGKWAWLITFIVVGGVIGYVAILIQSEPVRVYKYSEIQSEVAHRNAATKTSPSEHQPSIVLETPVDADSNVIPDTSNASTSNEASHPETMLPQNIVNAPARFVKGYFKGLTYPEAVKKLKTRQKEVNERWYANIDMNILLAESLVASTNEQTDFILSVFKMMTPEQLNHAREEALKTLSVDEVDLFFNDLDNFSNPMTPEEIMEASDTAIIFQEIYDVTDREIAVESEQIKQEKSKLEELADELRAFKRNNP